MNISKIRRNTDSCLEVIQVAVKSWLNIYSYRDDKLKRNNELVLTTFAKKTGAALCGLVTRMMMRAGRRRARRFG